MRVRPLTVAFVVVYACILIPAVFTAAQSVSALSATSDTRLGHGTVLSTTGALLSEVAIIVLFTSQAFIVWSSWVRPSAVLGGPRSLYRATRKINAREPRGVDVAYGTEEVRELR